MDISIIDYIGPVNGGFAILMSWILLDDYYEFIFWFNEDNEYRIYTNDDINKKLGVDDIHDWNLINEFIVHINSIIPSKKEIYKEFNIK